MKDNLLDLVTHTFDLGCMEIIKIEGDKTETQIHGVAGDKSVIVNGKFLTPIPEFEGKFGMPSLVTLKTILGLEPYQKDAAITVTKDNKGRLDGLNFVNKAGDFQNDYRFMVADVVEEKMKTVTFHGASWNVTVDPSMAAIQRLKFQALANAEESTFQAKTVDGDLVFTFGDHSTHAGEFVFEHNVKGELTKAWHWPIQRVISILSLPGDKTLSISDQGASQIIVNSGIAEYTYTLPAHTK